MLGWRPEELTSVEELVGDMIQHDLSLAEEELARRKSGMPMP